MAKEARLSFSSNTLPLSVMSWNYGTKQSPIDLGLARPRSDSLLRNSKFHFDYFPQEVISVENTGSTFKLTVRKDGKSALRAPGYLSNTYKLLQAHGHWGTNATNGSEHLLEGKGFAAELHFVHMNTKYGSFEEALKSQDGLAVIGVLLEIGNDNPNLEPLLQVFQSITYKDNSAKLEQGFDLRTLLPEKLEFYAYEGSLTTSPYSECVMWTVFKHSISISEMQLEILRSLQTTTKHESKKEAKLIQRNVRDLQTLNERVVKCSF